MSAMQDLDVTILPLIFQWFGKSFETLMFVFSGHCSHMVSLFAYSAFALLSHFSSCLFLFCLITHKPLVVTMILNRKLQQQHEKKK